MTTEELPELTTIQEAADFLRVNRRTLKKHLDSGDLRSVRIGAVTRIPRRALLEFAGVAQ